MEFWDILTKSNYQVRRITSLSDGTKKIFLAFLGYNLTSFELKKKKAYSFCYGKAYCFIKILPVNSESYVYLKT